MKKFALKSLLGIAFVSAFIVSCSTDSTPATTPETPNSGKKVVDKYIERTDGNEPREYICSYGANYFISKISAPFTYNGIAVSREVAYTYNSENNIATIKNFDLIAGDEANSKISTFEYTDGKITKQTKTSDNDYTFEYNADGLLKTIIKYFAGGEPTAKYEILSRDTNGNVLEVQMYTHSNQAYTPSYKYTYTYEDKENLKRNLYPEAYQKMAFSLNIFVAGQCINFPCSKNVLKSYTLQYNTTSPAITTTLINTFSEGGELTKQALNNEYAEYTYKTI